MLKPFFYVESASVQFNALRNVAAHKRRCIKLFNKPNHAMHLVFFTDPSPGLHDGERLLSGEQR